jgi:hypothetical protein
MARKYDSTQFYELNHLCDNPPVASLGHATLFLKAFFEAKNVDAIFFDGWAMFLRGSGRISNGITMSILQFLWKS